MYHYMFESDDDWLASNVSTLRLERELFELHSEDLGQFLMESGIDADTYELIHDRLRGMKFDELRREDETESACAKRYSRALEKLALKHKDLKY